MSGRRVRERGNRGELEVVNLLKEVFPKAHTTRNAHTGTRVAGSVDIAGVPLRVEVKRSNAPRIMAALRQAEAAPGADPAVAFTRMDRDEWVVTMRWDFFEELLGCWTGSCEGCPEDVT